MADQGNYRKHNTAKKTTLEDLEQYRFDPTKEIVEPKPILSLIGVPLCTPGNISNIQGQAKSAKTSVLGAAMAAMLRALTGKKEDNLVETMRFTSRLRPNTNIDRKIILHFDTEQSSYHHHKLAMDILTRAGIEKNEEKKDPKLPFYSYSLVCIEHSARRRLIEEKIADIEEKGINLACLVLDGVADLVSDPNNADESFDVVEWLHGLADSRKCVVLTIIHENPENGKARGHLGSQIQRKSETNLRVAKKGDNDDAISLISIERARGANLPGENKVPISWCKIQKRHLLDDRPREESERPREISHPNGAPQETAQQARLTKREAELKAWLEQQLKSPMNHTTLKAMVMKKTRCKGRTAITRINNWIEKGWIHKLYPEMKQTPYGFGPAPVGKKKRPRTRKQEGDTTAKNGSDIKKKNAAKKATQKSTAKKSTALLPPQDLMSASPPQVAAAE